MITIRVEKRSSTPVWFGLLLPVLAIVATLVLCSGFVALAGANVFESYRLLFLTPFSTQFDIEQTILKLTPLILTGLTVVVAFRARFWNIGGEGQLYAGAIAAGFIGGFQGPSLLLWAGMILAGALAGSLWALLPAVLRLRYKVDDVVSSLLLNFIMLYGMSALLTGPWKNPVSAYPTSPPITHEAEFPIIPGTGQIHLGVVIALLAALGVYLLLTRTVLGFAINAIGDNPKASVFSGIRLGPALLGTAAISGALAGLAGVGEVGGVHFQVMADLSPGFGYIGIVVAMLARLNPIGVIPAALFYAAIITGAEGMSRATSVPVFLADVIQGVSLLCMLIALQLTQYRLRFVARAYA